MSEKDKSLVRSEEFPEIEGEHMAKRALVVDPSAVARSAVSILLQRDGWEAIEASDGAEALMLAHAWHFDLVLTDPHPSKVPGLQLVGLLKGEALSPAVRVVLLVDEGEWIGEVERLADAVLVKNEGLRPHLRSQLNQMFENTCGNWPNEIEADSSKFLATTCEVS